MKKRKKWIEAARCLSSYQWGKSGREISSALKAACEAWQPSGMQDAEEFSGHVNAIAIQVCMERAVL
jgi:hypothetical protein